VTGRGDVALAARLRPTRQRGVFAATVSFPTSGPWILEAVVARRRFALGTFAVDVPINPSVREPFWVATLPDSSLLIGQRQGPLLRWNGERLETFAAVQRRSPSKRIPSPRATSPGTSMSRSTRTASCASTRAAR
jgi:hypothetical protein